MTDIAEWQWDEMRQVGTDYDDAAEVEAFEARQRRVFPNREQEDDGILRRLGLKAGSTLIDLGAGTGSFALRAAALCGKVHAVDVSTVMLELARKKAAQAGAGNIEFHHAGFLTYRHAGGQADAVVSMAALHHLPDAWKCVALHRIAGMLRTGGRLYLRDVVFTFRPWDYAEAMTKMVRDVARHFDEERMAAQMARHIRQEFSTFDWMVEGMLRRAGFRIDQADYSDMMALYLCTKVGGY